MLAAASCHLHTPYMLLSVLHTVQGSLPIHGGDVGVSYTLDHPRHSVHTAHML